MNKIKTSITKAFMIIKGFHVLDFLLDRRTNKLNKDITLKYETVEYLKERIDIAKLTITSAQNEIADLDRKIRSLKVRIDDINKIK